jgi:hypothetical protein
MIADALCVRGINVVHPMTSPARVVQGALSYVASERE